MKKILFLFAILMCLVGKAQENKTTPKDVFSTEKTKLLDADGQVFMIRGMNNPHAWFGEKAYTALDDIKAVGCNTIRIVWNTRGKDTDLERIIRRCIELEMIPMVELHDVTGNTSGERLAEMARWYAEPSRVKMLMKYERLLLLNIANEWGDNKTKADYWQSSYTRCIDIMRKAGYRTTLVIDAPGWGQNIDPIIKCGQEVIDSDPLHNILFSIHMYGSWNKPERIREKLTLCHKKELPLIVGEFGYNYDNGKNNLTCKVNHNVILDMCNNLEYGYMPWSWTGNNKENQWLDLVEPSDWKTLTWWGQQVISGKGGITETSHKASVFNSKNAENVEQTYVDNFIAPNGTQVSLHCIKHGSLSINVKDKWIYIDPVTDKVKPITDYTTMPKADYILVTHEHADHLDAKAIEQLTKEGTTLIVNPRSSEILGGKGEIMTYNDSKFDSMVDSRGWNFDAVPAYNISPDKQQFHPKGRDNGYVLTIEGLRIYIAGDTEPIPEMKDIKDIDIAFLPCNLPFTMTPEQLAEAAKVIRPKVLFPYHYGKTDIQQVVKLLEGSGIDVRIRQYQ